MENNNKAYFVPNPLTPCKAIIIDPDLCCGCNSCANVCRTDVLLPNPTLPDPENRETQFKPPCQVACPAGIDIKRQLAYIAKGQYDEALKLVKESTPLPLVCGRVCPRFCEKKCRRAPVDGAVAINMTKRFVADMDLRNGALFAPVKKPPTGQRVAVVGSGPAGLSAAYYLAIEGHSVTIFEADRQLGGLLRHGVPEHRLSKDILDKEIESIIAMCDEARTGALFGRDITIESLKADGFGAILLAVGAQGVVKLNVEGEDLDGVYPGVAFLRTSTPDGNRNSAKKWSS